MTTPYPIVPVSCLRPGCDNNVCMNDYNFTACVCNKSVCNQWYRELQEFNKIDTFINLDEITTSYYADICQCIYKEHEDHIDDHCANLYKSENDKKQQIYYFDLKCKMYKTLTSKQEELFMEQEANRWITEYTATVEKIDQEISQLKRRRME